jgi:hypothetical protein
MSQMPRSFFDGSVSFHASPHTIALSAKERNDARTDVIFAKDLKRPVSRRRSLVNESIDALLAGGH